MTRTHDASRSTLVWCGVAAAAALLGTLVVVAPVAAGACEAAVLLIALGVSSRYGIALPAVALLAVVPVVGGYADVADSPPDMLKLLDDSAMLLGIGLLVVNFRVFRPLERHLAIAAVALLALSQLVGILHTEEGTNLAVLGSWQAMRWVGAFGFGLWFVKRLNLATRARWTYRLLLGWSIVNVLVSLYQIPTATYGRFGVPTVGGLFSHPDPGSVAAATLVLLALTDRYSRSNWLTAKQRRLAYVVGGTALIMSARLQPVIMLTAVALFLFIYRRASGRIWPALLFGAGVPLLLMFAVSYASTLTEVAASETNPIVDTAMHASPRVQLLEGAERIADKQFPFGRGAGTFGSNLDADAEARSFDEAQIGTIYGFRRDDPTASFHADNSIARVLAENGYLGLGIWLAALSVLIALATTFAGRHLFLGAAVVGLIAIAPVGPAFRSVAFAFILLFPAALLFPSERAGGAAAGGALARVEEPGTRG
jgi:hypothetical protein